MTLARIHKLLQYPSGSVAVAFAYGKVERRKENRYGDLNTDR
jgi:hypothetical protein